MSLLTGALRAITKKASSPQSLIYSIQLERAKQKYIVRGELDGPESAIELGAPEANAKEQKGTGVELSRGAGLEAGSSNGEGVIGAVDEVRGSGVGGGATSSAGLRSGRELPGKAADTKGGGYRQM